MNGPLIFCIGLLFAVAVLSLSIMAYNYRQVILCTANGYVPATRKHHFQGMVAWAFSALISVAGFGGLLTIGVEHGMGKTPGQILAELLSTDDPAEKVKKRDELQQATERVLKQGVEPGTEVEVRITGFDDVDDQSNR